MRASPVSEGLSPSRAPPREMRQSPRREGGTPPAPGGAWGQHSMGPWRHWPESCRKSGWDIFTAESHCLKGAGLRVGGPWRTMRGCRGPALSPPLGQLAGATVTVCNFQVQLWHLSGWCFRKLKPGTTPGPFSPGSAGDNWCLGCLLRNLVQTQGGVVNGDQA